MKNPILKQLGAALRESLQSVIPIFAIVLFLSVTFAPMNSGVLVLFLFGTLLLILGMSFFTIGSGMSMQPLGEGIGVKLGKSRRLALPIILCLLLGIIITIAEPDLQVLAEQVPSIPNKVLIASVAIGVGIFLALSAIRTAKGIHLSRLLIILYAGVVILAFFAPGSFIPAAFDSGGVTTGPITVPFVMALGAGMATISKSKNANENSFGLIALCSIGPILSVLILSICFEPSAETSTELIVIADNTKDAFMAFAKALPLYAKEIFIALAPIICVLPIFQIITRRFHTHQILRMCVGFIYTYIGLVLFLTGANVGFMPAGKLIGAEIASGNIAFLLIPIGALMGYFVVSAEPAVHSLKKQVEEVTNGGISQKSMGIALSVGVGVSVGISMLRVLSGVPILPFLIAGYAISLVITFFVPPIYTGIAFDSGGVASGPMATTFILPFAIGACETLGGNVMTDAFGVVAMIAMTPLITIQVMGLISKIKRDKRTKRAKSELLSIKDDMIFYEEGRK